jgi:lysophospholipase L1-like esterase
MVSQRRFFIVVGLLGVFLLGVVLLSVFLYRQGKSYYLQLNGLRLDPLGLSYHNSALEQQNPASSSLTTVVFFGDSRAADWPSPELGQFEFINRGIGAETSVQSVLRFDYHVKPLRPQVVVIQVGINDLKAIPLFPEQKKAIIANCEENVRQIVEKSIDSGATVILTTVFPTGRVPVDRRPFWSDGVSADIEQVNSFIRSLEADDVLVFDAYAVLVGDNGRIRPEYSRDLLHLSNEGYERLNEAFVPILTGLE